MESATTTFIKFLRSQSIDVKDSADLNIKAVVSKYFDKLDESMLRTLVQCALAERDKNISIGGSENELLGTWGILIDSVN